MIYKQIRPNGYKAKRLILDSLAWFELVTVDLQWEDEKGGVSHRLQGLDSATWQAKEACACLQ